MSKFLELIKEKGLVPKKIEIDVALSSTGLNDPKIVELMTYVTSYYDANGIPANIEGSSKPVLAEDKGLICQETLFYDKINPGKPMESGASAITGITDRDLAGQKSFSDSKFVQIFSRAQRYENVEIKFTNNYAFDLLNTELKNIGNKGFFTYKPSEMVYDVSERMKFFILEDLAMRFLDDRVPTFSLANIVKAMSSKCDESFRDSIKSAVKTKYPDATPNAINLAENLGVTKEIIDVFKIEHPEIVKGDFTRDNTPLTSFPFKGAGKRSIQNIWDVSLPHLYSIFSKVKHNSGVAMMATIKAVLETKYPRKKFKDTLLDFYSESKKLGMFEESNLSAYSDLFVKTFKSVDKEFVSNDEVKNNPTLDAISKIRNQLTV